MSTIERRNRLTFAIVRVLHDDVSASSPWGSGSGEILTSLSALVEQSNSLAYA